MCGDGVVGGAVLCRREALFKRRNGSSNRLKFKDIKTLVLPFPRSSDRTTPYQLIIRAEIASKNGTTEAAPVAHQRISVTPKWYAATWSRQIGDQYSKKDTKWIIKQIWAPWSQQDRNSKANSKRTRVCKKYAIKYSRKSTYTHVKIIVLTTYQEFNSLADDANIYKLVGPVLLKQDTTEAKSTVDGRLEYIGGEMYECTS
jgi:chaperonin cofactor prefoldin